MKLRTVSLRRNWCLYFGAVFIFLYELKSGFNVGVTNSTTSEQSVKSSPLYKLLETDPSERFLWYAPHSGFGNQLIAFRHALRVAGLLNRTLIVPPILRHFDTWLGRCEQKKLLRVDVMRRKGWAAISRLFMSVNYVSMADVVDVSVIPRTLVRTIDLRLFAALHCGVDIRAATANCSWCGQLVDEIQARQAGREWAWSGEGSGSEKQRAVASLSYCGRLLGALQRLPGAQTVPVEVSCDKVVWTYGRNSSSLQLVPETRSQPPLPQFVCPRRGGIPEARPTYYEQQYLAYGSHWMRAHSLPLPERVDVLLRLGAGKYAQSRVLSLGSAMHYYELEAPLGDAWADSISCATTFLPFVPPVMSFAELHAAALLRSTEQRSNQSASSFLCLHFRGGDGWFKEEAVLRRNIQSMMRDMSQVQQAAKGLLPVFLMSDLKTPAGRTKLMSWFGRPEFDIHFPSEFVAIALEVSQQVTASRYGLLGNRLTARERRAVLRAGWPVSVEGAWLAWTGPNDLLDMSIYMEQAVCSCAGLGFLGSEESTICQNIHHMRAVDWCSIWSRLL